MKNLKDFLSFLQPYKKRVFLTLFAILIANLLGLVFPWVLKIIIDDVIANKDFRLLNILAAGLVLIFAIKFYFGFLREYLISLIGEKVTCDLRSRLYWQLQRLSVNYAVDTPSGNIISGIIGDIESIRKFLFGGAVDFAYSFLDLFFILAILLFLDWRLTLIASLFLPIFALAFLKLSPRLKEKHELLREKYADLTAGVNEVFSGIRIVAGFAREKYEAERFSRKQSEIFRVSMAGHKLAILLWTGSEFLSSLGLVTLVWFGARSVFSGRISPGSLVAFYSYLGMLFFPVIKMAVVNDYYQEAAASLERIRRILQQEPKIAEKKNPLVLNKLKGIIKFSGVTFSYDGRREALSGINLEVGESQVVGLVGKSGAGKTTLINLLLRFYDPTSGFIFMDGCNLKDLELKSYRSRIAMVLQDDYLFSTTVKENILYGRPDASESDVIKVAKLANAEQFISALPDGYNTHIGERGIKLSYGQRQRISIARAILRDPAILILDEATSSVDSQTECLIIEQAYKNLICGRTTFIIAHRFSTVTHADNIVFLDNGRITEAGTHLELLDKKGDYWRMWRQQAGFPQDSFREQEGGLRLKA